MVNNSASELGKLSVKKRREKLGEQEFKKYMQEIAKLPRKKK